MSMGTRAAALALGMATAAALAGCGDSGKSAGAAVPCAVVGGPVHGPVARGAAQPVRFSRARAGAAEAHEQKVAESSSATTTGVVLAGGVSDVETSGRTALALYVATSEEVEGPVRAAWRLYDDRHRVIAQARSSRLPDGDAWVSATAVPGGYVTRITGAGFCFVDQRGHATRLTRGADRATRPGDVQLDSATIFRPGDRVLFRSPVRTGLADSSYGDALGPVLAADGTWWAVADLTSSPARLLTSTDGRHWTHRSLRLSRPPYASPAEEDDAALNVVGNRVALSLPARGGKDDVYLHATRPDRGGWSTLRSLPGGVQGVLPDGRLLLGDARERKWLLRLGSAATPVSPPAGQRLIYGTVLAGSDGLRWLAEQGPVLGSRDGGRTWTTWLRR